MKKRVFILLCSSFFLLSCGNKKEEAEVKAKQETEKIAKEINSIADEVEKGIDILTKESEAIENALNELDNL